MLFDTHAHLDDDLFDADRESVIERMREAGVALCMSIGADLASSEKAVAIAQAHDGIYAAVGIHPNSADGMSPAAMEALEKMQAHHKVRAIGEIGLDYYRDRVARAVQIDAFEQQLDLARRVGKPVSLHIREAHGDAFAILKNMRDLPPCVVHCYSGSTEMMREYVKLGCYISFTGAVTFKNADKQRAAALEVPENRLMVETDAPYMTPVPFRGHRNESAYVAQVAQMLAQVRGVDYDALCAATTANGLRFFGIEAPL